MARYEGVRPGSIVDNKYEILAPIGAGGMSNVWLAQDNRLGKLWAIKEKKPNVIGAQGEANRRAIIAEANFMKQLDHPAIPRVVDILEIGPAVYVVMDYVDGRSLNKALRDNGGPFDQNEVIDWGIQLCDVLGYLHSLGIVYRDMKPANVMLRYDGSLKLIDFGIARKVIELQDNQIIGSPGYSAPEQIERDMHEKYHVDTRADIYALGATLFSLVTGRVPKRVTSPDGSVSYQFDIVPIRSINPQLSDGLETVLQRATCRDPNERYQTLSEMRYDLEHYEELTREYRAVQQSKIDNFRAKLRAAAIAAAAGVACLALSVVLTNSSYDSLVHQASAASTEETNVSAGNLAKGVERKADPSEAEALYTRAIDVAPDRIQTYEDLLNVYKQDEIFTPTEARRWTQIWQKHGRELEGSDQYARLCYDAGVLYLCYYDYMGVKDQDPSAAGTVATGEGAVENATQSAEWFKRAHDACNPDANDYKGLIVSDSLNEYAATEVYQTIGDFHTTFTTASREGRDASETYKSFWGALTQCLGMGEGGEAEGVVNQSEPIVQLRLYQVAFESVNSPTYLSGFMNVGVSQAEAQLMLDTVKDKTDKLASFAETNRIAAGAMFDEIEQGYEGAVQNVGRTYGSPVARLTAGQ